MPLLAYVLVMVPVNKLVATLPTHRMPAFLAAEDWGNWLGEEPASLKDVQATPASLTGKIYDDEAIA